MPITYLRVRNNTANMACIWGQKQGHNWLLPRLSPRVPADTGKSVNSNTFDSNFRLIDTCMGNNFKLIVHSQGRQHNCRWLNGVFSFPILVYACWQHCIYFLVELPPLVSLCAAHCFSYQLVVIWCHWWLIVVHRLCPCLPTNLFSAIHLTFRFFVLERNSNSSVITQWEFHTKSTNTGNWIWPMELGNSVVPGCLCCVQCSLTVTYLNVSANTRGEAVIFYHMWFTVILFLLP